MATASETVAIYNAVLQRNPTDAELAAFVAGSGTPVEEEAQIELLVNNAEAREDIYPFMRIYQAIFGRVPDASGLTFWVTTMRDGLSLQQIVQGADLNGDGTFEIAGFRNSPEFSGEYGAGVSPTSDDFITALYNNLLNRAPDQAGFDFFTGLPPTATVGDVVIAFTESAEFANAINAQIEIFLTEAANGTEDYEGSVYDINDDGVVDDNDVITEPPPPPPPEPGVGQTFTLTAALAPPDGITGTADNDTFRAIVAGSLQATDTLDGGDGNDLLTISAGGLVNGASPVISDIERIDNADANKTLNLSAATGVDEAWTIPGAAGTTTTYTEAQLATRFGYENTGFSGTIAIDYRNADLTGSNDTALLAANNPGTLGTFNVAAADAPLIEAVDITAAGPSGIATPTGTVGIISFTAARTLTVTGEGNLLVAANANTLLTTVDASATTGINIVSAGGSTQNMTVTGGSGNGQYFTGSGNDAIDGGLGADLMAGGAGADTYVISTTTIEVGGNDSILIGNFTTGTDKLEFGGPAGSATNYVETAVASNDFLVARSAATTQFAGNGALDYVAVQVTGGVFVFFDGDGDNALSTNGTDEAVLIQGINLAQITHTDII